MSPKYPNNNALISYHDAIHDRLFTWTGNPIDRVKVVNMNAGEELGTFLMPPIAQKAGFDMVERLAMFEVLCFSWIPEEERREIKIEAVTA